MAQAHELDGESAASGCRFIVQSEDEDEAIELAKRHTREVHGHDHAGEELGSDHVKIV